MAINTKHPWEKNPILSRTLTSKEDFEIVNKKALANLAPEVKGKSWQMVDGYPHKMTANGWVPLTKM